MDQFKLAITVMAADDTRWGPRDAEGRRRQFSAEELDALAEFSWPWAGVQRRLAAGVNAMRARWRPRARTQSETATLPSAEATARA